MPICVCPLPEREQTFPLILACASVMVNVPHVAEVNDTEAVPSVFFVRTTVSSAEIMFWK